MSRYETLRIALLAILIACGSSPSASPSPNAAEGRESTRCEAQVGAPAPLPGVEARHRQLEFWLARTTDGPVLDAPSIDAHNASLPRRDLRPSPLDRALERSELEEDLRERFAFMRERIEGGRYLQLDGQGPGTAFLDVPSWMLQPRLFIAQEDLSVHCAPRREGLYTASLDADFDRNLCFTARAGEAVEVLATWGAFRLARTDYGFGFIDGDGSLGEEVPEAAREAIRRGVRGTVDGLPAFEASTGEWVRTDDFSHVPAEVGVARRRAFAREDLFREAFSYLDSPYGWGGRNGGRDCSRFLLDVFASFGMHLPRHSSLQAQAGTFVVDVSEQDNAQKLLLLDEAEARGIVLLHFPGHIMLYLGKDEGRPFVLHSFSEYVTPCEGEGETLHRVDRVDVSDMSLGEGSSRTDFLSRLTHISVFGMEVGSLAGAARVREAVPAELPDGTCDDRMDASIFRSPQRPNASEDVRIIGTTTEDHGPVTLSVFDDEGERVDLEVHGLGGPPFTRWASTRLRHGRYTAVLGDGPRVVACERFVVARSPPPLTGRPEPAPAWESVWSWERDTENLYAAFVEQLFADGRSAEEIEAGTPEQTTWPNLQALLRDPARNLLYNHRHVREDEELELVPDCADLPYFLRAYFAWKLRLPFAWRQCRRGRDGRPPICDAVPANHRTVVDAANELDAFRALIRLVRRNVHSSTDRTRPLDDASDVYPVPLTRYALRPGTIFADPFGHVLVTTGWRDAALGDSGALLAADAQPDGTVGRRRFWRGSFLFTPDTQHAGAGFKNWRPVRFDRVEEAVSVATNAELRTSDEHVRFSQVQYEGDLDAFYDRVDSLINRRPLPAQAALEARLDALHEQATRRVLSVQNGEDWVRAHGAMEMPEGASIFQTEGPWEDFATPSRDMRLLIALDAVVNFVAAARRRPERFGLDSSDEGFRALEEELREGLSARTLHYVGSSGAEVELSLAQLVERSEAMEMAYNPNDCMERRWGVAEGSPEMAACRRRAPEAQRHRMTSYRGWFSSRQRPAR